MLIPPLLAGAMAGGNPGAVDVVAFALNTSTGSQTITGDLGGRKPIAAVFLLSGATALNTTTDHARIAWGVYDGTNQAVITMRSRHGQASTDNLTYANQGASPDAQACELLHESFASAAAAFDATGFVPDGVTINITTAGSAFLGSVLLIADDHPNARAKVVQHALPSNGATDHADVGFRSDLILFGSTSAPSSAFGSGVLTAKMALGIALADATQAGLSYGEDDGEGTSQPTLKLYDNRVLAEVDNDTEDYTVAVSDVDAQGWTETTDAATSDSIVALALKLPSFNLSLDILDTPTSMGTQAYTDPGFKPSAIMVLPSGAQAVNTLYTDVNAESFGVGIADSGVERALDIRNADAQVTTLAKSLILARTLRVDVPGAVATAALDSLDANGFTLDFQEAPGTAQKFIALSMGIA